MHLFQTMSPSCPPKLAPLLKIGTRHTKTQNPTLPDQETTGSGQEPEAAPAHRLLSNLQPEQPGWLCGLCFTWNMLQTVPFRTIIAFLRTIMYYVWCIIYSGGYWFIKELWANCQVIVWTVVMSNNKGYNLHPYSVFKLMSYPVWNSTLGVLFLCFLLF